MSDYISRADAINAIEQSMTAFVFDEMTIKEVLKEIADNTKEIAISRIKHLPSADAVDVNEVTIHYKPYPSADATMGDYPNDLISRNALMEYCSTQKSKTIDNNDIARFPSADAVPIHNDGTLEVKVPNAHKVGRVLVTDTDSHIGGGLFYPDDAVQGEWVEVEDYNGDVHYKCDQCGEEWTFPFGTPKENNANFCPNCGSRMKGGAE